MQRRFALYSALFGRYACQPWLAVPAPAGIRSIQPRIWLRQAAGCCWADLTAAPASVYRGRSLPSPLLLPCAPRPQPAQRRRGFPSLDSPRLLVRKRSAPQPHRKQGKQSLARGRADARAHERMGPATGLASPPPTTRPPRAIVVRPL